jgi:4-amino-4-deoxy-L-arabinose transferase-like glycosyltransferase
VSAALLGLTAALTAVIAHRLYGMRAALRAGALLATLPLLVRMGGIAMNELLITALATATVLIVLSAIRAAPPSRPLAYGAALGSAIGAAMLVKYTMALLAPAALGLAIVNGRVRELGKTLAVAFAITAFVFVAWWLALDAMGAAEAQLAWLFGVSRSGLGSPFGRWSAGEALVAKLPSAIGLYQLPLLLVGLHAAWGRGRPQAATLLVWIATISIPLLLTLPENRYFLPAFPAVAILLALGLERLPPWRGDVLLLALLLCLVTVAYYGSLEVRTPAQLAS